MRQDVSKVYIGAKFTYQEMMEEEAVPWISYYPKELHRMDAFGGGQNRELIHASEYAGRNFGIPFSPYLTTEEQDVVIGTICKACGQQL